MTKLLNSVAALAALAVPQIASAQALPAPVIGIVDIDRATSQCNACKTAIAALNTQLSGLKSLETSLGTPIQNEYNALQAAAKALNGKEPDAALKARAEALPKKQADAQRQLTQRQQQIERNRAYVQQQVAGKLDTVLAGVAAKRGASMLIDSGSVLRAATNLDVTADVIAGLNAALPTISTNAPAAAPAKAAAAPKGR